MEEYLNKFSPDEESFLRSKGFTSTFGYADKLTLSRFVGDYRINWRLEVRNNRCYAEKDVFDPDYGSDNNFYNFDRKILQLFVANSVFYSVK